MKMGERNWSMYAFGFAVAILVFAFLNQARWNGKVIQSDVISYYSYLPAAFIYDDVGMTFVGGNGMYKDRFWGKEQESKRRLNKFTMGYAVAYSPFFFVAHLYAKGSGYAPNGFSDPYSFMLLFGTLIYGIIGLFFFRMILRRFFSESATAITLLVIALGTNYFSYVTHCAPMAHASIFCFVSIYLELSFRLVEKRKLLHFLLAGLLAGWIVLTRPSNSFITLFPVLLLIGKSGFGSAVQFARENLLAMLLMVAAAVIVILPQLLYWNHVSGSLLSYSYGDESFHFLSPHVFSGLFSFRNGWLIYTPVMIFSLIGFYHLRKKVPDLFLPSLAIFLLVGYLLVSWWCWWFGGSFGNRAFIDLYPILGFSLASFVEFMLRQRAVAKFSFVGVLLLLTLLNQFQAMQYRHTIIYQDAMTWEAYKAVFLKLDRPENMMELIEIPDYEASKKPS